jgi:hypothetical protein
MTNPTTPATPAPLDLAALAASYPEWSLRPAPPGFAAEHTSASGRHIRYIAARTIAELAEKLSVADLAGP